MPLLLSFFAIDHYCSNGHKVTSLNGIVQRVVCFKQRSGAINRISVSTSISLSSLFDIAWDL